MGKGQGWFGLRWDKRGGGGKGQSPLELGSHDLGCDRDDDDLCGVGIVFYKAPDNSLFVKALVEGSSACNCGILPGDCLMEANGKNVYCKGIEQATKIILGKEGTVVTLKLIRVDRGKRIPISASLVREMRATANPEFNVKRQDGSTQGRVSTQQVFLECLQNKRDEVGESAIQDAGDGEDAGAAGVFGDDFSGISSSSSSSRPASLVPGDRGAHARGVREGDAREVEARRGETERKVKYKGHWYTESQITAMEEQARVLKHEVDLVENFSSPAASGVHSSRHEDHGSVTSPKAKKDQRLVVGPTLVDLGKGPKPLSKKEEDLNADPEALRAAIQVVEGSKVEKLSSRKLVGRTLKSVFLKISTGGVLTWGKGKEGHVMWVKAFKQQYDPSMKKDQYNTLNRSFFVMLEGEQVMAHSSQGGTIRASEAVEALEFIASTVEARDVWVMGIKMVLGMAKKEALERETQKRLKEVHAAASFVPSVFITGTPKVAETPHGGAQDSGAVAVAQVGDTDRSRVAHREAGAAERYCGVFGSPNERESARRAEDRARRGWGGKIEIPAGKAAGAVGNSEGAEEQSLRQRHGPIRNSHEGDSHSGAALKGDHNPQPSEEDSPQPCSLSSASAYPSNEVTARRSLTIYTGTANEAAERRSLPVDKSVPAGANYASCSTCWPPVSPKSARKTTEPASAGSRSTPDSKVKMSPTSNDTANALRQRAEPRTKFVPSPRIEQNIPLERDFASNKNARCFDGHHISGGRQAPSSRNDVHEEQQTATMGVNIQSLSSLLATGALQQPSSGDSEGEQILSQSTTAEDTPRPLAPSCTKINCDMNNSCTASEVMSKVGDGYRLGEESKNLTTTRSARSADVGGDTADMKHTLPKLAAPPRRPSNCDPQERPKAAVQESQTTAQDSNITQQPALMPKAAPARANAPTNPFAVTNPFAEHPEVPHSLPQPVLAPQPAPVLKLQPQQAPNPTGSDLGIGVVKSAAQDVREDAAKTSSVGKLAQRPVPGKAAEDMKEDLKNGMKMKKDFAAMMAARQKKMREAEDADEGMYFQ